MPNQHQRLTASDPVDEDDIDHPGQFPTPIAHPNSASRLDPLELGSQSSGEGDGLMLRKRLEADIVWPHLSVAVTTWLVLPALTIGMAIAFCLLGRIWTCFLFALHLTLALVKTRYHMNEIVMAQQQQQQQFQGVPTMSSRVSNGFLPQQRQQQSTELEAVSISTPYRDDGEESGREEKKGGLPDEKDDDDDDDDPPGWDDLPTTKQPPSRVQFWATSLPSLLDIVLFGMVYPAIGAAFRAFFIDYDGESIVEWSTYNKWLTIALKIGWMVVIFRICIGTRMLLVQYPSLTYYSTSVYYKFQSLPLLGTSLLHIYRVWLRCKSCFAQPPKPLGVWHIATHVALGLAMGIFLGTFHSLVVHFGSPHPMLPHDDPNLCDPLDTTECCLPFPSAYHLKVDNTTETGYRVNLNPRAFPTLKGRIPISMDFLNKLDGFSTMGPILFYLPGMKDAHESYKKLRQTNATLKTQWGVTQLRGHEEIDLSVTPFSSTLLLDVQSKELVAHSAEIDYLDPKRPLILLFPAKPLKHNRQYAVAVINATDANGERLPPSPGLLDILEKDATTVNSEQNQDNSVGESHRLNRQELYVKAILPALETATHKASASNDNGHHWGGPFGAFVRSKDPHALQLLFDFQTISHFSQLGPVKAVRDGALNSLKGRDWSKHVRVIRQWDGPCRDPKYPMARTIHGEIDVPWYLKGYGPGTRDAILDPNAVESHVPTTIGKAKFVVHIPCSLRLATLGIPNDPEINMTAAKLKAVVEFGHGLFYSRAEAADGFLIKMAHRNGWIMSAMDWRGMSQYDFPLVARTMLTDPSLFEPVRDNLIQGYANKYALQHFISNGLLTMPWMKFQKTSNGKVGSRQGKAYLQPIPLQKPGNYSSVFYGISQGGILGAGYVGLSGPTGLISRGVLGVPGSPFSLILSRSLQFLGYDQALLLNFYNNRHVRIFLSMAQMCWDSVEAAGVLAEPVEEPIPQILMQAGLGDHIVPTLAAERLARALNATILPHNPRHPIYGIEEGEPFSNDQPFREDKNGPHATLTEMLYEKEYESLPVDDELKPANSNVHLCVRLEPVMQQQIEVFFNEGKVIDPCEINNATACIRKKSDCFQRHLG